jgi:hypothetical protein
VTGKIKKNIQNTTKHIFCVVWVLNVSKNIVIFDLNEIINRWIVQKRKPLEGVTKIPFVIHIPYQCIKLQRPLKKRSSPSEILFQFGKSRVQYCVSASFSLRFFFYKSILLVLRCSRSQVVREQHLKRLIRIHVRFHFNLHANQLGLWFSTRHQFVTVRLHFLGKIADGT